jgi:hypothetical protein
MTTRHFQGSPDDRSTTLVGATMPATGVIDVPTACPDAAQALV